ncbi:hypothetical protein Xsto_03479 [Xenorhabdus stockiae]|uniref:Uncharacterized protein n=1 Tax=Xenorhabdus stockiae TaxID=351614 RepID=A0A2D0KKI1_9GAMM|nr:MULTISPECIES: hypothetical protein [Xenorhabdus]PHM63949.1 hypothetical protein Xsto_03479 [Xenorhabdus stockiae]PHM67884.1 hypothetical protein Xekj_03799 [Xenorhabdus sp. KJ12.1]
MRLIKAALLIIATVIALPSLAAENKKYESMTYAGNDYYMDIRAGKIYGIYDVPKNNSSDVAGYWFNCSAPVTERVTVVSVTPDERTIEKFKVKDSKGDYATYNISPIYKDIPDFARGYISSLIKQDAKIKLTSRACGSGGFPTFESVEPIKKS